MLSVFLSFLLVAHTVSFSPVTSVPPATTSSWQKCDKKNDPTAPACSCPCNSELVTITQMYPGHLQCIDPSFKGVSASDTSAYESFECSSNFKSVASSGVTCSETPLLQVAPIEEQSSAARRAAGTMPNDPAFLLRCDCFSQCLATSGCQHVVFVDSATPACQLFGEICTPAAHGSGLAATLFRKGKASEAVESSGKSCQLLKWALTDGRIPQTTCAAAGVCSAKDHANILPGGRCKRRCSGDVEISKAEKFCEVLGARLCEATEIYMMDRSASGRSCGGDFNVLNDAPAWTANKWCVVINFFFGFFFFFGSFFPRPI